MAAAGSLCLCVRCALSCSHSATGERCSAALAPSHRRLIHQGERFLQLPTAIAHNERQALFGTPPMFPPSLHQPLPSDQKPSATRITNFLPVRFVRCLFRLSVFLVSCDCWM